MGYETTNQEAPEYKQPSEKKRDDVLSQKSKAQSYRSRRSKAGNHSESEMMPRRERGGTTVRKAIADDSSNDTTSRKGKYSSISQIPSSKMTAQTKKPITSGNASNQMARSKSQDHMDEQQEQQFMTSIKKKRDMKKGELSEFYF